MSLCDMNLHVQSSLIRTLEHNEIQLSLELSITDITTKTNSMFTDNISKREHIEGEKQRT